MFNLSLCAFLKDLNQHLDPCCLRFSEETFKNSPFSHFRADFTEYVVPESSQKHCDSEVWVSKTSLPRFSFLCSFYVDVKAVLIYMLWIYCPVITFKDGLGKSAQSTTNGFTCGRIMARRATRGHQTSTHALSLLFSCQNVIYSHIFLFFQLHTFL